MSEEAKLIAELRRLYDDYEKLNRRIANAAHRQRFSKDSADVEQAVRDEKAFLVEIDRLMTRMRAIEGHLMRVRKKVRPVLH